MVAPETQTQTKTTPKSAPKTTAKRSGAAQVREGLTKARHGATTYVRQGTERAVDVPVGAALSAADRVNELVGPWTSTDTRDGELKDVRSRFERELNKFERRGGTARRKATQRVRRTRNRVEREVEQRRRSVETTVKENRRRAETTVKENRRKAEDSLKKAQTTVQERVSTLV
ncbi:MAG: hypothetical protein ABI726_01910 [bacterium]